MIDFLIIGIGGFLGAIARYAVFIIDNRFYQQTTFPLGTLAVNLFGSLLIGVALGLSMKYGVLARGSFWHFLFITGFLGAFTTFSTFSQDGLMLLMQKEYWFFFLSLFLNVFLGIALAAIGYFIATKI